MAGIILNGSVIKGLMLNGSPVTAMLNGVKVFPTVSPTPDPYNPLGLPPFTIRCKFAQGTSPNKGTSFVQVDAENNIWDITNNNTSWAYLFAYNSNLLEVLGANTTGVTNMGAMFEYCRSLTSVPIFDTSSATDTTYMFEECAITSIPLFNTSNMTNMAGMFYNCYKVESGALALYQQASTQSPVPTHAGTFYRCGRDTVNGAAELAQIPSDWK